MKVTAQEEYGLRCLLQLARHHGGEPLLSRTIAEREGISIDYVKKLLMCLRQGELVESVRGLRGGFLLTRGPDMITVSQVLRILSAEALVVSSPADQLCQQYSGQLDQCIHLNGCSIRPIWTIVSHYVSQLLDQITIADLLQEEAEVHGVCEHAMLVPLITP